MMMMMRLLWALVRWLVGWAYSEPSTISTGTLVAAADWNELVNDIIALKDPPSDNYEADEGADWTTTNTTFGDIDDTGSEFTLSITTTGGDVMVGLVGSAEMSTSAQHVSFNLDVDGSPEAADDGLFGSTGPSAVPFNVSFTYLVTGLTAGAHTIKLQWKVSGGTATFYTGAGTTDLDYHPQFWVREVS